MALPKPSTATTAVVSVLNASATTVLAADTSRIGAIFCNDSANVIYLKLGSGAVVNSGIRLNPNGGTYIIDITNLYTGIVTGRAMSGASNLLVTSY